MRYDKEKGKLDLRYSLGGSARQYVGQAYGQDSPYFPNAHHGDAVEVEDKSIYAMLGAYIEMLTTMEPVLRNSEFLYNMYVKELSRRANLCCGFGLRIRRLETEDLQGYPKALQTGYSHLPAKVQSETCCIELHWNAKILDGATKEDILKHVMGVKVIPTPFKELTPDTPMVTIVPTCSNMVFGSNEKSYVITDLLDLIKYVKNTLYIKDTRIVDGKLDDVAQRYGEKTTSHIDFVYNKVCGGKQTDDIKLSVACVDCSTMITDLRVTNIIYQDAMDLELLHAYCPNLPDIPTTNVALTDDDTLRIGLEEMAGTAFGLESSGTVGEELTAYIPYMLAVAFPEIPVSDFDKRRTVRGKDPMLAASGRIDAKVLSGITIYGGINYAVGLGTVPMLFTSAGILIGADGDSDASGDSYKVITYSGLIKTFYDLGWMLPGDFLKDTDKNPFAYYHSYNKNTTEDVWDTHCPHHKRSDSCWSDARIPDEIYDALKKICEIGHNNRYPAGQLLEHYVDFVMDVILKGKTPTQSMIQHITRIYDMWNRPSDGGYKIIPYISYDMSSDAKEMERKMWPVICMLKHLGIQGGFKPWDTKRVKQISQILGPGGTY